jgi:hypothetical protein
MQAVFTGFDSAWSAANSGAICDLLLEDGSLRLATDPVTANWNSALVRAKQEMKVDLQGMRRTLVQSWSAALGRRGPNLELHSRSGRNGIPT